MNERGSVSRETCTSLVQDAGRVTHALVEDLRDEELVVPYMDIINPFIWELGHVAFFYDCFLLATLDAVPTLCRDGNELYNSFEVDHVDRWTLDLPGREATLDYMATIRERVLERIAGREPGQGEVYCYLLAVFHEGDSGWGCRQMFGNVWEWTSSSFYPFPGYIVDEPYREYSAPWFGVPMVLKGGCWATRSSMLNTTYRNFFEPTRRDVFAGFRTCAR